MKVKSITVYVPSDGSVLHPSKPRVFYSKGERVVPKDAYHAKLLRKGKLLKQALKEPDKEPDKEPETSIKKYKQKKRTSK